MINYFASSKSYSELSIPLALLTEIKNQTASVGNFTSLSFIASIIVSIYSRFVDPPNDFGPDQISR